MMPMFKNLKLTFVTALLAFITCTAAYADKPVRFAYDVGFDMNFDNREYYKSNFSRSMTIFGARLTPSVGLQIGSEHKVMIGIDVMKDFGSKGNVNKELLHEMTLYYRLEKEVGEKTGLTMYAGVFPRSVMDDRFSQAFFSDSLVFYDNNLEGLLLKLRRPNASFELGCDWMGMYGEGRRERFMVFSSGEGSISPLLSLGYSGYMYHYANSVEVGGVVDNILLNPYVRLSFAHMTGLQVLSARIGWLQGLQNDRKHVGSYVFPGGGELDLEVKNWNVGVRNSLFYGSDMMPYYNSLDSGGYKYGNLLYPGDLFYRVHDDGSKGPGTYDRLEVFWEPKVGTYLKIRVGRPSISTI